MQQKPAWNLLPPAEPDHGQQPNRVGVFGDLSQAVLASLCQSHIQVGQQETEHPLSVKFLSGTFRRRRFGETFRSKVWGSLSHTPAPLGHLEPISTTPFICGLSLSWE